MCVFVYVHMRVQPLELICEKAIATCNRPLGAGEALRRVMECLASGILLPGELTCILREAAVTRPRRKTDGFCHNWSFNPFYTFFLFTYLYEVFHSP